MLGPPPHVFLSRYARYAKSLRDYFASFLRRTQPLMPLQQLLTSAETDFQARWDKGEVARWQSGGAAPAASATAHIFCRIGPYGASGGSVSPS